MNKLMIVLGLLLIAGVSFAMATWPMYQYNKYSCSYWNQGYGQWYYIADSYGFYDPGYQMYYLAYPGGELYGDLYSMSYYIFSPAQFKTAMTEYNYDYSTFRMLFNTALRSYLEANPEDTEGIMTMLNYLRAWQLGCMSGS